MIGMVLRIGLQAAYFVVVARTLGVNDFGAFSAIVALAAIMAPFSTLGSGNLFTKHVRRDRSSAGAKWSLAIMVTLVSGICLTGLLTLLGPWVAPPSVPWMAILLVGLTDLLLSRIVDIAGQAHLAMGSASRMAFLPVGLVSIRLVAALVLAAGPWEPSPLSWAALYLASTIPVAAIALYLTRRLVGRASASLRDFVSDWREGIYFSVSLSAQSIYNDIDKVMLGRLSSLQATGVYTAAYRIVDVACAPMRGIFAAAYPRFFDYQAGGIRATLAFTRRLAAPVISVAAAASLGLFACADLAPLILGAEYVKVVGTLRALAFLPILKAVQTLAADTLTGAGFQGSRASIQVAVAVLNIGANLVLIPIYSLQGAVAATLGCDAVLAIALWILVVRRVRQDRKLATSKWNEENVIPDGTGR